MANLHITKAIPVVSYTGDAATHDLFGSNFLFARDGSWNQGQVSQPYIAFANEVGLTTLRYPGGTMTEEKFDMANPNSVGDTSGGGKGLVPLSNFLDFAASINASATIVIPTYRLFTNQLDQAGQRLISANAESLVRDFIQHTLHDAARAGTSIRGFELGNEWWVDNTEVFGFRMSPVEYGRMANFLARIIQEEIDSYNTNAPLWDKVDPDIVIQVGPGGNAEWYTLSELGMAPNGTQTQIRATEVIFRQLVDPVAKSAIDGILTHRYLSGTDQAISGWAYNPFLHWESLAKNDPLFNRDFRKYVTEWNVKASNPTEIGLRQFDSMVLLAREMMIAGVDLANVWAVQQNNNTKLIYNTGLKEASYGGLTFGGIAFDMMAAQLPGLRPISSAGSIEGLQLISFGSDSRMVCFLTNKNAASRSDVLIKSTVPAGTTHVSIYEVAGGPDGRPTVTVRTIPYNQMPNAVPLDFTIDETVMVVFAKGEQGIQIEGYDQSDSLIGTLGHDSISGGNGNDTIIGSQGNDTIRGEEGNDLLIGGDGDDFIDAGLGSDTVVGGNGNDTVFFGTISANLNIDLAYTGPTSVSSNGITISLIENVISGKGDDNVLGNAHGNLINGSEGDDVLNGRDGDDTIRGGEGNDFLVGGAGNDIMNGGAGRDYIDGGEGNDWITGGNGDDFLFGSPGDDIIEGFGGNDNLNGGDGGDILLAGAGDDTLLAGAGSDRSFGGIGDDLIFCESGNDVGDGGGGDDLVIGGSGADSLSGGDGDDILIADLSPSVPASFLRSLHDELSAFGIIENLLSDDLNTSQMMDGNRISGGQGDDILLGGGGDDFLSGGLGDDWIFGFGGDDTVQGGLGEDSFVFDLDGVGRVSVVDFANDKDTLILVGRFGEPAQSVDSFLERFASVSDEGILIDYGAGAEIQIHGVTNLAKLYDDFILITE